MCAKRKNPRCRICLSITTEERDAALIMDPATRRNLELDESLAGKPELTLAGVFDRTATAMGGRMLRRWLHRPLRDHDTLARALRRRRDLIESRSIRRHRRSPWRPSVIWSESSRELPCARRGRAIWRNCARRSAVCLQLQRDSGRNAVPCCSSSSRELAQRSTMAIDDEHALLARAIVEAPPHYLRDGGVIAPGYDAELDELRLLGSNTEQFLLDLEARERERSGLSSLKLGFNRVQGFFIEVNRSQADRVPAEYLRRQTVKSAERFITPELKSFEDKVLGARDRALAREKELYEALLDQLTARLPALQATTAAIAQIDVLQLFRRACHDAATARSRSWSRSRCC